MSQEVIRIEGVSKQYRLGMVGTGTIRHDLNRWWHRLRGKEDPYLKIGEANDRTSKGKSPYVWALRDVSFSVNHGDVVGIIGRNGAGKSTLLKILSRTTAPTLGSVKVKGRIASLLEVGTGFHPELTGRENVYLNGAIMGMTRREITRKFDEIVDFAGVEKYIDTPVKRYSSGMYVRLAFGVAAHLEPEILVVDEVLAVGDAEFQKKALGKMQDVSRGEGRTVLFVSHNLGVMRQLCQRGILLHQGSMAVNGPIHTVVDEYLSRTTIESSSITDLELLPRKNMAHGKLVKLHRVILNDGREVQNSEALDITMEFTVLRLVDEVVAAIAFSTLEGQRVLTLDADFSANEPTHHLLGHSTGAAAVRLSLPRNDLQPGLYSLDIALRTSSGVTYDMLLGCTTLEVLPGPKTPALLLASPTMGGLRIPAHCTILQGSSLQVS